MSCVLTVSMSVVVRPRALSSGSTRAEDSQQINNNQQVRQSKLFEFMIEAKKKKLSNLKDMASIGV